MFLMFLFMLSFRSYPETNIAPENQCQWSEDYFSFGARPIFSGYVSFREGTYSWPTNPYCLGTRNSVFHPFY